MKNLKEGRICFDMLSCMMIIKYLYPVFLTLLSIRLTQEPRHLIFVILETVIVFVFTNVVATKNSMVSWIVGTIALFIIYAQTVVLFLNGGFIQLIMLTNVESIEALRGKAFFYGITVIASALILLLPITWIPIRIKPSMVIVSLIGMIFIEAALTYAIGSDYSPVINSASLLDKAIERTVTERRIRNLVNSDEALLFDDFYSDSIGDGVERPSHLSESPNVILIFTEGMSRNILDDPRNITPNLSQYAEQGLSFNNYYDHTAATYRGIIGQLYSSHQFNNGDTNLLVSLQSVFKRYGYETTFVNSEPENGDFTDYLNSFGYDTVTSGEITDRSLTDGEAYSLLFDELEEAIGTGTPQFLTVYTFGTHVTFDSEEELYGNGVNRLLNRFYNCDYQFGKFMKNLSESGYGSDTVIIFTADHAAYVDEDYSATFPYYERFDEFADTMPLFIWYEGVEPSVIDVGGRNSLDLTPTILDFLDMDSPNYFLGSSLFQSVKNPEMETVFCVPDSGWCVKTDSEALRYLTDQEISDYMEKLENYLSLTMRTDTPIP